MALERYVAEYDGREVGRVSSADRLVFAVVVRNVVEVQSASSSEWAAPLLAVVQENGCAAGDLRLAAPRVSYWSTSLERAQRYAADKRYDRGVRVVGIVKVRRVRS